MSKRQRLIKQILENCEYIKYTGEYKGEEIYIDGLESFIIEKFDLGNGKFNLRVTFKYYYFSYEMLIMFCNNLQKACYRFDFYDKEYQKTYETDIFVSKKRSAIMLKLETSIDYIKIIIE